MKHPIFLYLFSLLLLSCYKEVYVPHTIKKLSSEDISITSIITKNASSITSKKKYLNASVYISDNNTDHNLYENIKIRGRGNSSWESPKKPYQIKFESSQNLLGMPQSETWNLLANYSDKTMLRNETAFELSRFSNLEWTPESKFTELYLNNVYQGVYQITAKIEEAPNRVDLEKNGYILEIDHPDRLNSDDIYFKTENFLFNIKHPALNKNDNNYNFIKDFITLTEKTILADNFRDPVVGYRKYIDIESFIDWYLINEITKNNDALFHTSVYLNYIPGGKLKMGPVWDYDISLGNVNYNNNYLTEGFWIKNSKWYSRLFEDPYFVERVKVRFNFFYNNRDIFQELIDTNSSLLNEAQERNFSTWKTLGKYIWPNYVYFDTYNEEVDYLKQWLEDRFNWLNLSINKL